MNRLLTCLLLIVLFLCSFVNCQQPVGDFSESGDGVKTFYIIGLKDYFLDVQSQRVFHRRDDHVKIIGIRRSIGIDDNNLLIEIIKDPLSIGPDVHEIIAPRGNFEFAVPGEYILKGTYNGMTDEYPFEVLGSPREAGDGFGGVGIEWLP